MTTEDDFQAALDAHPDDWQTRLVFADWLQDHGDPRAEGYRVLGAIRRVAIQVTFLPSMIYLNGYRGKQVWVFGSGWDCSRGVHDRARSHLLTEYWLEAIPVVAPSDTWWRRYLTRREVEDAAALAFANLPAERRAELLAQPQGA